MGHIDTSEIIRASVWIRPTGAALDHILDVRRRLSLRKQGPEVPPHLTLLSGMETTRTDAGLKLKRNHRRRDGARDRRGHRRQPRRRVHRERGAARERGARGAGVGMAHLGGMETGSRRRDGDASLTGDEG